MTLERDIAFFKIFMHEHFFQPYSHFMGGINFNFSFMGVINLCLKVPLRPTLIFYMICKVNTNQS
jgi:hypothetical protein